MFANVVAYSYDLEGNAPPIVTMHLHYPRIIHSELMTHRVFSRNARSSRAVPVKTMLNEIRNDPFVPWHWGKNQKGMQAGEECSEAVKDWWGVGGTLDNVNAWCQAATQAANAAEAFMNAGYHKQVANRLLEPFSWIDTLVTSTSWANFFHLRDHEDAEPHFRDLARLMHKAIATADPKPLKHGEWHLPYINENDRDGVCFDLGLGANTEKANDLLIKLSVARCARISYKPFDGDASVERELERYDQLVGSSPLHASPAEHQATPDHLYPADNEWEKPEHHGNFNGWIQYRKTLANEAIHGV